MARKRFTPEQIITMLREAEVLLSQGAQVSEVWRKLGISDQLAANPKDSLKVIIQPNR